MEIEIASVIIGTLEGKRKVPYNWGSSNTYTIQKIALLRTTCILQKILSLMCHFSNRNLGTIVGAQDKIGGISKKAQ